MKHLLSLSHKSKARQNRCADTSKIEPLQRHKTYNVLLQAEHSPSPQTHSKRREGARKCVFLTKTAR
ncbi:hypothetical protein AOLI_G00130850 [Acnodon oligacanthus]